MTYTVLVFAAHSVAPWVVTRRQGTSIRARQTKKSRDSSGVDRHRPGDTRWGTALWLPPAVRLSHEHVTRCIVPLDGYLLWYISHKFIIYHMYIYIWYIIYHISYITSFIIYHISYIIYHISYISTDAILYLFQGMICKRVPSSYKRRIDLRPHILCHLFHMLFCVILVQVCGDNQALPSL